MKFNNFDNNIILNKIILNEKEVLIIKKNIINTENCIKKKFKPQLDDIIINKNLLTSRKDLFNWLYIKPIGDILIPKIRNILHDMNIKLPVAIECWANIFRFNEGLKPHNHIKESKLCNDTFLTGHIFIDGPINIGTQYLINNEIIKKKNTIGELTLISSKLIHSVPKNKTNNERISIAFNIHFLYLYCKSKNNLNFFYHPKYIILN